MLPHAAVFTADGKIFYKFKKTAATPRQIMMLNGFYGLQFETFRQWDFFMLMINDPEGTH